MAAYAYAYTHGFIAKNYEQWHMQLLQAAR